MPIHADSPFSRDLAVASHLAASLNEDGSRAQIWDIVKGRPAGEFPVRWDFGGKRLAISASRRRLITGAYQRHGVSCYEIPAGDLRWSRSDLKRPQRLRVQPGERIVTVGRELQPLSALDLATGESLWEMPGARDAWFAPSGRGMLVENSPAHLLYGPRDKLLAEIELGPQIMSAALVGGLVFVAEFRGPVYCLAHRRGAPEQWRTEGEHLQHCIALAADAERSLLHAVYHFQGDDPEGDTHQGPRMVTFAFDSPEPRREITLRDFRGAFSLDGGRYVCASGDVLSCPTGKVLKRLPFRERKVR